MTGVPVSGRDQEMDSRREDKGYALVSVVLPLFYMTSGWVLM
jgi:hypothetical protein